MLVTINTPRGPRKVSVCDYCKTVCTTRRFCSGRCAREYDKAARAALPVPVAVAGPVPRPDDHDGNDSHL